MRVQGLKKHWCAMVQNIFCAELHLLRNTANDWLWCDLF